MKELLIYPNSQTLINIIKPLYAIDSGFIKNDVILKIKIDDFFDVTDFTSNIFLDFKMPIKILQNTTTYQIDYLDLKQFLIEKQVGLYSLSDYLLYCLVFTKDTELYKQVERHILNLTNESLTILKVYINFNGNTMKSAKTLYLHRNTLIYKLDKIEKAIMFDLSDIKTIHCLSFILTRLKI